MATASAPSPAPDDYAGVFHDLVGNVAQFVLDTPATLSEQLDAGRPHRRRREKSWFTPERLTAVSVVGGSAVSPPSVDPTKPYPPCRSLARPRSPTSASA